MFYGNVFRANVLGREQRDERRRRCGLFHIRAAAGFLPLHQAQYAGDLESKLAGGLNRLNGRSASGAYVVHDYDMRALFAEALNSLSGAVCLLRLADQKSVDR